ncbi:heparin lyase I family protein [Paenibacillus roseipurpureus]|uniref:Heparin lyase I family protein n=1 Tax=Paenibacillus roseopurpureus TaxID=2918901 RepID=A0AA96RL72_9BACL|nr:heparin lyase I family protein [Paenibacillus sp. MBLB1832]WNR42832.1 heparin lyase I family protein [Paenibacillus sp. MBLB1832]
MKRYANLCFRLFIVTALINVLVLPLQTKEASAAVSFYNSGTTSGWDTTITPGKPYNLRSVTGPTRDGGQALRMELRYGEPDPFGSYHSEVVKNNTGNYGQTRWYGFSTYVPDDYVFGQNVITTQWWSYAPAQPVMDISITSQGNWSVKQQWVYPQTSSGLNRQGCWLRC